VMLASAFADREAVAEVERQVKALREDGWLVGELLELLDVLDDRRRVAPR
jgi:hypothetical protein